MKNQDAALPLGAINPSLSRMIEDTILFGQIEEMERLLELVTDHPDVSDHLKYGLESLHYFRSHYGTEKARLTPSARQSVSQFDTDWSMQLLELLRDDHRMEVEKASA